MVMPLTATDWAYCWAQLPGGQNQFVVPGGDRNG